MATLDFSADQAVLDNLETVTFTSVRTAGNQTVNVTDATIDWITLREAQASNGVYQLGDAKFTIRQSLLTGVSGAKPRDTITRSDTRVWTILSATPPGIEGVWNLTARDLVLANDLRQTGTLSRPSNAQDTAGRPTLASYTAVVTDVPCRVQPEGGTATDQLGRKTIPQRFTAFLGQQVEARAKDKFVAGGVTYTVLEWKNPERITDLMSLTLEKVL